jgi:hypothetical protein
LPEKLAARDLLQLHLGHAHLVRAGPRGRERQCRCQEELHFSYFTVYFFANARTAAVRCSAMVASIQSCSTTPRSL